MQNGAKKLIQLKELIILQPNTENINRKLAVYLGHNYSSPGLLSYELLR